MGPRSTTNLKKIIINIVTYHKPGERLNMATKKNKQTRKHSRMMLLFTIFLLYLHTKFSQLTWLGQLVVYDTVELWLDLKSNVVMRVAH